MPIGEIIVSLLCEPETKTEATSFARLPVAQVVERCCRVLAYITRKRKQYDREYVRDHQLRHNRWWGWWTCLSFKESKEDIQRQKIGGCVRQAMRHFGYPSYYRSKDQLTAKQLLSLSEMASDGFIHIWQCDHVVVLCTHKMQALEQQEVVAIEDFSGKI